MMKRFLLLKFALKSFAFDKNIIATKILLTAMRRKAQQLNNCFTFLCFAFPDSSPVASYVQRRSLCINRSANV